ncbi:hypothetical protein [Vibrio owensii]|uniref:hypothetical protein n=1 Tax=Vibrio owensii TaxID=696485 RepID=UPI0018F1BB2E|nr:hypothetical protein [Vibrio owensii]
MKKMYDGVGGLFGQMTVSCPSKERLNSVFMNQNIYGSRLDLVYEVCKQHIDEVLLQNDLLNKFRLKPAGWTLEYRPMSQDNFYAHASRASDYGNNYEISFTVAIPAILMSIAIELDSDAEIENYSKKHLNSINDWFPHITSIDEVDKSTIEWVLDACLLLYFHEVCHVLFGHCDYVEKNNDELRAMEMDADFNAGSLLALNLKGLKQSRIPNSPTETVNRVVRASFLVGVALKALSAQSDKYHFPSVRTLHYQGGCISTLITLGDLEDFVDETEGNEFYGTMIENEIAPLRESLRRSSLKYYAGTEVELAEDLELMKTVTVPTRDMLKDGVLKSLTIPIK